MSDLDEKDWLTKHGIHQFMKDQLSERKEDKQDNDNSFVFLEKSTLNRVLLFMLLNEERRTSGEVNQDGLKKILEDLEYVIADNKKDFEELITLLKE